MSAEEALEALARDLVEEIAAARAVELAAENDGVVELAVMGIRPQVKPFTGQQGWAERGEKLWGGRRFHDLDPRANRDFTNHMAEVHRHLSDEEKPRFARGYEALHRAHTVAAERLLPRAETDAQKQAVRDAMVHIRARMRAIDKAAAVKSTRTRRLTAGVPERARRAKEAIEAGMEDQGPQVVPPEVKLPFPPLTGAAAVHPHLAYRHVTTLAGDTISGFAHGHVPQPFPVPTPAQEVTQLNQANSRIDGYAKREANQRDADLRDHLQELRRGEAEHRRRAREKKARESGRAK